MFDSIPLARTRLMVPPQAMQLLPRPRLLARLDTLTRRRAVAVQAPAGYGKSSLLATWASSLSPAPAWYSAAPSDDDVFSFLAHWLGALEVARPAPWFEETVQRLHRDGVSGNRWRTVVDQCINGMLDVSPTAVVIDDAHHLRQSSVLEVLSYLLHYLPPTTCVVLSSRRSLSLAGWDALCLRDQAALLGTEELALDDDELGELYRWRRGAPPETSTVLEIRRRCGGWPLAVDVFIRNSASVSATAIESYLTTEIWNELPPSDREFLLQCTVLDTLTPAICAALTERADGAATWRRLLGHGVLTIGNGCYKIQQLFLEFLRGQLDSDQAATYHRRAAAVQMAQGQPLEAAGHLAAAGDATEAAALLLEAAPTMLLVGRHEKLLSLIDMLGAEVPLPLQLQQGHALRQRGAFEAAVAAFSQVAKQSHALHAPALAGLGRIYVDTLQPLRAHTVLRQAFRLVAQPEERAALLDLMAENYLNQGRIAAALRFRRWARRLPQRSRTDTVDARLLLRSGQLRAARAVVEGQLEARRAAGPRAADGHRENMLVLSYIAALEGDVTVAEQGARAGLEIAAASGSSTTEAVAWMRLGHALQLRDDTTVEAIRCYSRALAMAADLGVERLRVEPLMGLALLHARGGDIPRSYACATDGLAIAHTAGDDWLAAYLRLACGIAASRGHHPTATDILRTARAELEKCRDTFGVAVAGLWLVSTDSSAPQPNARHLQEHGFGFLLERATLLGPGPGPSPEESSTLRIQTLGTLRVWREDSEIGAKAWKREKARELFLILLTRRGTACHKETLMELLWPEASANAADRDFRVALHALSQALDPQRPKNAPARWVERRGSTYILRSDQLMLDVDEFERFSSLGDGQGDSQAAATLWKRAVDLYRGDYLEEFPYNDWCHDERDRLRTRFLQTAERLAQHLLQCQDYDGAIDTAHDMLRRDKCWEAAYRILMRAYLQQGRAFLAARAYEQCQLALEEELGVEPSADTTALLRDMR